MTDCWYLAGDLTQCRYNQPTYLEQGAINHSMHQSNSSNPASSRSILKLKPGTRKSPREAKTPPPRPQSKLKPGARWSDD
jgi:hypothetical protein